ncbi:T9SS type A sorting domain-containing protein, partial [Bacteroidales bacterium AH-315-I05]|nr:T9SS type A sorting domain-containing protein [Bacteroidales bacterium AH-315-I05]
VWVTANVTVFGFPTTQCCNAVTGYEIRVVPQLTGSAAQTAFIDCGGNCDAEITMSASGGSQPLSFLWDDTSSQTDSIATGLCAGTYNVTVTDDQGTAITSSVIVTEPAAVVGILTTSDPTQCSGTDGSASLSVSGGTSPYSYQWDAGTGSQTTSSATGLVQGTYYVTVTDANACTVSDTATLSDPPSVSVTASSTQVTCGASDGTATASLTGGTSPFTFLWDSLTGSQTNAMATGLTPGTYSITVTDAGNCSASVTEIVNSAGGMTSTTSAIDENCGLADGSASVTASGGVTPFSYQWDNGQTMQNAVGLSSGTHNVTVSDVNGCVTFSSATVSNISGMVITVSTSSANCGSTDGSATANPNGGTAPFIYQWNDVSSQTSQTATGLASGTYNVTVTDSIGCQEIVTANISTAGGIVSNVSTTDASCGQSDGSAVVTPTNGVAPYTYQWNDIQGQTTQTATGLAASGYTVTVTDSSGCQGVELITISSSGNINASGTATDDVCGQSNGSATATPNSGQAPFIYIWDDPTTQTTQMATGLSAGTYNATVFDANNCSTIVTVVVSGSGGVVTANVSTTNDYCGQGDGTAIATGASGNSPFTYSWSNGQTTQTATGLLAGIYYVTVTGSDGCLTVEVADVDGVGTLSITTNSTADVLGNCNGNATTTVFGGTGPYTYQWNDPDSQTTSYASGLCAGTYNVTVTDINGCITTATVIVQFSTDVKLLFKAYLEHRIYPNPNSGKFILELISFKENNVEIELLNMLGQNVYLQQLTNLGGKHLYEMDVSKHPPGVYSLLIHTDRGTIIDKIIIQ